MIGSASLRHAPVFLTEHSMPKTVQSKSELSFAQAMTRLNDLRTKRKELREQQLKLHRELSRIAHNLQAAVKAEDFATAAALKAQREAAQAQQEETRTLLRKVTEEANAIDSVASSLYFRSTGVPEPESVTVTRAYVVNPTTGHSDDVIYTDSSETVYLRVGNAHFEAEAYHLGSWAAENGLFVHYAQATVKV